MRDSASVKSFEPPKLVLVRTELRCGKKKIGTEENNSGGPNQGSMGQEVKEGKQNRKGEGEWRGGVVEGEVKDGKSIHNKFVTEV